ncbi:mRNA-capping enzyme subunit beta [Paramarasmius palmivorus]|uniref:mRNA-capping enzyme subunit beta n=1 Tax=Paramarasmius palmivorus TaxID=297713 RepID=A0AAW0DUY2_9AGAR
MPDFTEGPPHKRARHTQENGHSNSMPLPPLSLSILGVEPLDEFIKEIADFIHHMITVKAADAPPGAAIEVEAKIGLLKEKERGGQRLHLPLLVETILQPDSVECRFESNMTVHQHKHFNGLLNKLKVSSSQPGYASSSPMDYNHLYLVDSFYSDNASRDKIRVTRDEKSGQVVETIRKVRLGDLNIYSPKRAADWRVSVNLEIPVSMPTGQALYSRRKDRMSYSHEEFTIDLTQVNSSSGGGGGGGGGSEILHELEIEITRPELLAYTAARRGDPNVSEHERSAFDELIRAFVNNARILVRNAMNEGWH